MTTGRGAPPGAAGPATGRSLVPVNPAGTARGHLRSTGRTPNQACAFLAHLSLQYDGIAARRRARRERLDAAISSYGEACGKTLRQLQPGTVNLRV